MKWWEYGLIVLFMAGICWGTYADVQGQRRGEQTAIERCHTQGGRAVLQWDYNADTFMLKECLVP